MATFKRNFLIALIFFTPLNILAQKIGLDEIKVSGLKSTIDYIASDKMKGRKTGEEENNITARFLASQASVIGLKPLDEKATFLQPFELTRTSFVPDSNCVTLNYDGHKTRFYSSSLIVTPLPSSDMSVEGPVLFAGYGINSAEDNYFDLKNTDAKDKILLVLDRAPSSANGKKCLLKDDRWMTPATLDQKFMNLVSYRPKAIMLVLDPKSGHKSIEEIMPGATQDLSEQFVLTGISHFSDLYMNSMPKVFLISPEMADSILKFANTNLKAIQDSIDTQLKPHTMDIPGISINFQIHVQKKQIHSCNVAGILEGSDSADKRDALVYTAHFDHIGMEKDGRIDNGADDNASGSAALLEIAKALKSEQKMLKRSVIFLWTSGEELGLMGSKYYTEKPLFPLKNTIADINLDMIGRSWTPEDTGIARGEQLDVKRADSIFVAGGKNCRQLLTLGENAAKEMDLKIDYAYNSLDDPKKMYYRSDHYSFAEQRIPAIFYTTGLHRDYHSPGDIPSKLDYTKMLKVTKLAYLLGYSIATQKDRLENNKY